MLAALLHGQHTGVAFLRQIGRCVAVFQSASSSSGEPHARGQVRTRSALKTLTIAKSVPRAQ